MKGHTHFQKCVSSLLVRLIIHDPQWLISYSSGYFLQPLRSKSETIRVLKAIPSLGSRFNEGGESISKVRALKHSKSCIEHSM